MNAVEPIRNKEELAAFESKMKELGEREHILYLLGIYTGLRISDILKLQVKDVKNKTHIEMREQKTGKEKKIFINPNLKRELKPYIQEKAPNDYLIASRNKKNGASKALTRVRVWQILKNVREVLEIDKIGCHSLRKTFGFEYYQKSKDIAFLQELFNHSTPKVTLRYIGQDQLSKDSAFKNMDFR